MAITVAVIMSHTGATGIRSSNMAHTWLSTCQIAHHGVADSSLSVCRHQQQEEEGRFSACRNFPRLCSSHVQNWRWEHHRHQCEVSPRQLFVVNSPGGGGGGGGDAWRRPRSSRSNGYQTVLNCALTAAVPEVGFISRSCRDLDHTRNRHDPAGSFSRLGRCWKKREMRIVSATIAGAESKQKNGDWSDGDRGVIFSSSEIALVTGGVLRREGQPGTICTDSRDIHGGDWFVCLKGPNFDGHEFLQTASDQQCSGAIGQRMPLGWSKGFVEVADTLDALQRLGKSVRSRFHGAVVGITGSVGKTTTRKMIGLSLAPLGGKIHETERNFNNHVGVPLTLLRMPSTSSVCVLELGMNHLGEIADLAAITVPTIRVITNVGPVHLEGVGSIENVAKAKGELFDAANAGDVCIINADDERVASLPIPAGIKVVRFGRKDGCDIRLLEARPIDDGKGITCILESSLAAPEGTPRCKVEIKINSPGIHLAECACAALAVAGALDVSAIAAAEGIAKYEPVGMRLRLEFLEQSGITLINDAYNASPMSVAGALKLLSNLHTGGGRRVALLGDMLELGPSTSHFHLEIVRLCDELKIDMVGYIGDHFSMAVGSASPQPLHKFFAISSPEEVVELLPELLARGDTVLVKGSRGIGMECICRAIDAMSLSSD